MLHQVQLTFREKLALRSATKYIVLHHTKVRGRHDIKEVHQWHLNRETNGNKWAGIAYHYYIDKDGEIFAGRPKDTIGAHTKGYNSFSVGVCFEGDFDVEKMSEKQLNASVLLISVLSLGYHNAVIRGHRNFNPKNTCPGRNFPMQDLLQKIKVQKQRFIRLYGDPESVDYGFLLDHLG